MYLHVHKFIVGDVSNEFFAHFITVEVEGIMGFRGGVGDLGLSPDSSASTTVLTATLSQIWREKIHTRYIQ